MSEEYVMLQYQNEQLKKDLINRQGVSNVDAVYGSAPSAEYKVTIETDQQDAMREEADEISDEAPGLHSEVKRLIAEKDFTEERLAKALAYYEVNSIEELPQEAAENFIEQLLKL